MRPRFASSASNWGCSNPARTSSAIESSGLQAEIIDPPRVAEYIRTTYPERSAETLRSGNLSVLLCEAIPAYGLALFDDRIGICTCAPDSGTVQALVDTGSEPARDWAETTYERYRREATPLSADPELSPAAGPE